MAVQTLTYGDKQFLNQNADIPATNKVQDTDMNEIKRVVNNNANELSNNINAIINLSTYSLTEINTGKKWIDNKDIYQKTLYISSLPNATTNLYDTTITGMNEFIYLYGKASGGLIINGSRPDSSALEIGVWYDDMQDKIRISTGSDRSNIGAYITILYTKTS